MGDMLELAAIGAALFGVYALILGKGLRGRVGRPPSGIGTRFTDPSGEGLAATALAAFAINTLMETGKDGGATLHGGTGAALGLLLALLLTMRVTQGLTSSALSVLGLVAAVVAGVQFVSGPEQANFGRIYRTALVLLTISCFTLAVLIFRRASALKGARGLALFGLVDIAVFVAGPGGAQMFELTPGRHTFYVLTASVFAFLLGWAVSEFTLGLTAIGVAVTTVGLSATGLTSTPHAPDEFTGVVATVVVFLLVRTAAKLIAGR